jgi:PAS domain-containing protein
LKSYQPVEGEKQVLLSAEIKNTDDEKNISDKNELEFVNNVCDFYFNIDKTGTVEYISQTAIKHIGFTQELIVGKKYFDFISEEDRSESKKIFENFVANGLPYKIVGKTITSDKEVVLDNERYFAPKYNEMGKFTGYCVLVWLKDRG